MRFSSGTYEDDKDTQQNLLFLINHNVLFFAVAVVIDAVFDKETKVIAVL